MTFLPVVERELRVAARRRNTYRARFGAALIALLVAGWVMLISQGSGNPARLGSELFSALAILSFLYTLLAGTRVTADCLSEEAREGTLGLLFLTQLKGYDVVFGKLAATSMNAVYGLLGVFPILAISLLAGGVEMRLFGLTVLVLLNTLFFSLSAGMLVSALSRDERRAMGGTFLLLLFFTIGVPLLGVAWAEYGVRNYSPARMELFLIWSPFYTLSMVMRSGSVGGMLVSGFWWSLLTIHLLGWCGLFLACRIVPRAWQDKPASVSWQRWKDRWQRWCHGDSAQRKVLREQLLEINPFLWLARRDRLQQAFLWGYFGLLGAGFFWGYAEYGHDWLLVATAIATTVIFHITFKLWVAADAVRRFIDMRRENALELLMSTPMTVKDILHGQQLAFRRLFGIPLIVVLAIDILMLWMGLRSQDLREPEEQLMFVAVYFVGMVIFVADYYTLSWVGLWCGLGSKNTKNAFSATVARVLALPWGVWILSLNLMAVIFMPIYRSASLSPVYFVLWWFLLSALADFIFGRWAWLKMHNNFRTAAMQRYQPPSRGWFWNLLRRLKPR